MAEDKKNKLNEKQKRFAEEYIIDLNATQAAIRAGYSENTAKEIGCQNLTKLNISEYVQGLISKRSKRTEITADNVLRELAKLAFSNTGDLYDEAGNLKPVHEMDRDVSATIQEVTQDTIGSDKESPVVRRKYKTADKKSSLELLGKHLKLFTEKHELTGKDGGSIETTNTVNIYIPDNGRD